MASVYVLKPVRNALFLDRIGIEQLPYVLLLVAVVGGCAASLYARFSGSWRVDRLVQATYLFLVLNLLLFRVVLPHGQGWLFYLFYVWVNLFGLVATSLLWLLANAAFDPREARRLFGFVGTGGIAGAIAGGVFTGWAADRLGTENLLVVCAGLVAVCAGLIRFCRAPEVRERDDRATREGALATVVRNDLLRYLGLTVGIVAVVAAVADIQFNQIADAAFKTKNAKTAFFGTFFAYLNGFAFLFQLFVTPRVLRSRGVGTALLFLPACLAAGSLGVLLIPGLFGGIAVKVGDVGFRHSIQKSATEILFLPLSTSVKKRTKVFLDTTVDNVATGVGALLVLVLTGPLGVPHRGLAWLSLALIVVWLGILRRVRAAYVDAFRRALARREIDLEEHRASLSEAGVIASLGSALSSSNERQAEYALDLLGVTQTGGFAELLAPHLNHSSAGVRSKALRALQWEQVGDLLPRIRELLHDADADVRLEAMHLICVQGGADRVETLRECLRDSDPMTRAAALGCIATYGTAEERDLVGTDTIEDVLAQRGPGAEHLRAQVARVLGTLDRPELRRYLAELAADGSPVVAREAIRSMGRPGGVHAIEGLVSKLADRRFRAEARYALAAIGDAAVPVLDQWIGNENEELAVRRRIPGVLGQIPSSAAVEALAGHLDHTSPALRYHVIKSLNKLRARAPHLRVPRSRIQGALGREMDGLNGLQGAERELADVEVTPGGALLLKAVREKGDQSMERVFRLLGLLYHLEDMHSAYLGLMSTRKPVRASALEYLDNVLHRTDRDRLFAVLAPDGAERESYVEGSPGSAESTAAVSRLLESPDAWLRACAVHHAGESPSPSLTRLVESRVEDPDAVVSQEAVRVVQEWETGGAGRQDGGRAP